MTNAADNDRSDEVINELKSVRLSDRDIQAATQLLHLIANMEHDRGRELSALAKGNVHRIGSQDRSVWVERARQSYVHRARRSQVFSSVMFGEAAWDMLLALYVTDQSSARNTVSGLVDLSGVPPTTALRWLDYLEKEQLVTRKPNPLDRRVVWILLTDKARDLLDEYFSGTISEGM